MLYQMRAAELPMPIREYQFLKGRRFKFDFAWPELWWALEIEGGLYVGGRHTRPAGYENDCNKYNLAMLEGWRVLRAGPVMVRNGMALKHLERALKGN